MKKQMNLFISACVALSMATCGLVYAEGTAEAPVVEAEAQEGQE